MERDRRLARQGGIDRAAQQPVLDNEPQRLAVAEVPAVEMEVERRHDALPSRTFAPSIGDEDVADRLGVILDRLP